MTAGVKTISQATPQTQAPQNNVVDLNIVARKVVDEIYKKFAESLEGRPPQDSQYISFEIFIYEINSNALLCCNKSKLYTESVKKNINVLTQNIQALSQEKKELYAKIHERVCGIFEGKYLVGDNPMDRQGRTNCINALRAFERIVSASDLNYIKMSCFITAYTAKFRLK